MNEALTVTLVLGSILWAIAGLALITLGIAMITEPYGPRANRIKQRWTGYKLIVTGVLLPIAAPYWLAYWTRWAIVDAIRTHAEVKDLDR